MAMVRCDNGHFYRAEKHTTCPHCGVQGLEIEPTRPRGAVPFDADADDAGSAPSTTDAAPIEESTERHEPASDDPPPATPGRTVGLLGQALGFEPVVGWLVCVEGPNRGRDYRLRPERNFIGRSSTMDVSIPDDETISRDKHAVLSYEPRNSVFRLAPGDGRRLTYVNGDAIDTAVTLTDGDVIELGATRLVFVPFCGDRFTWS